MGITAAEAKTNKALLCRNHYTEAGVLLTTACINVATPEGTTEVKIIVPTASANDPILLISTTCPGRAIRWRTIVEIVVNIFAPFPNVSMHIV